MGYQPDEKKLKVLTDKTDVAMLLWDSMYSQEEYVDMTGKQKPDWDELEEFNKDIFLEMADRLLGSVRLTLKPSE